MKQIPKANCVSQFSLILVFILPEMFLLKFTESSLSKGDTREMARKQKTSTSNAMEQNVSLLYIHIYYL